MQSHLTCKDWWNWIQYGNYHIWSSPGFNFQLYINDLPNFSEKLSFRIFADDTKILFTSSNPNELNFTMNEEIELVLKYMSIYSVNPKYNI